MNLDDAVGGYMRGSQSAPSVDFSELDTFANEGKVRPGGGNRVGPILESIEEGPLDGGSVLNDFPSYGRHGGSVGGVDDGAVFGDDHDADDAFEREPHLMPERPDTEEELHERVKLIAKLKRKNAIRGDKDQIPINEHAPLETLRLQARAASYDSRARMSVLMMRRLTVFLSRAAENLHDDLDGWGEHVYLGLDQYDDMLYDIHDKYGDQVRGDPLMMYVIALGSNACMYALTRKLVKSPAAEGMIKNFLGSIAKQQQASGGGSGQGSSGAPAAAAGGSGTAPALDIAGLFKGLGVDGFDGVEKKAAPAASVPPLGDASRITDMPPLSPSSNRNIMQILRRQRDFVQKQQQSEQGEPVDVSVSARAGAGAKRGRGGRQRGRTRGAKSQDEGVTLSFEDL